MPASSFDFYSLLIPFIICSLGCATLGIAWVKHPVTYLYHYGWALLLMGLNVLATSLLSPEQLLHFFGPLSLLYFVACALHSHAIYLRLQLQPNAFMLSSLILLGSGSMLYYSVIDNHQPLRIIWVALITSALYLHHPQQLLQQRMLSRVDRYIKGFTYALVAVCIMRAVLLIWWLEPSDVVSSQSLIWAMTQFMFLLINIAFLTLFGIAVSQDILQQLSQERDLDSLTGLPNRRALDDYIQHLSYSQQHLHALLLLDLDHFKAINDQYGHSIGDGVLQQSGQVFQKYLQHHDHISRIGGEEFMIILSHTDPSTALATATQLCQQLQNTPFITPCCHISLTTSIGVSFFSQLAEFPFAHQQADRYLYEAKNMGRNRVRSAYY